MVWENTQARTDNILSSSIHSIPFFLQRTYKVTASGLICRHTPLAMVSEKEPGVN